MTLLVARLLPRVVLPGYQGFTKSNCRYSRLSRARGAVSILRRRGLDKIIWQLPHETVLGKVQALSGEGSNPARMRIRRDFEEVRQKETVMSGLLDPLKVHH